MSKAEDQTGDIKAVLFDLDGVLVDSYDAWFHQFQDALRHFGFEPICEEVFRLHWGQSTEHDVNTFMPGVAVDAVRQYFHDHYDEYMPYLKTTPYAHRVLKQLKCLGLMLGCVTNSHRIIVQHILHYLRMDRLFDVVITADDVIHPKPAPDMLVETCKQLDIMPQHALFVGDTDTDFRAGTAAGCRVIGFRNGEGERIMDLDELLILAKKNLS
jgi:HAD superfamily hydrolase (TIGR01509 family)